LEKSILERIKGIQERIENNAKIESAIVDRKMGSGSKELSLSAIELAGFALIASEVPMDSGMSEYRYNDAMDNSGFTGIAANIAIRRLMKEQLVERFDDFDREGNNFPAFRLTHAGWDFLENNLGVFNMRKSKPRASGFGQLGNDEIPF
jgi:hypothetical protein